RASPRPSHRGRSPLSSLLLPPPRSTLFPYTTLFRSIWPIEGEEIDLAEVAREALLLALPLAPLCRDDCTGPAPDAFPTGTDLPRSEEHTSELQSRENLVCRLLLEKKKTKQDSACVKP